MRKKRQASESEMRVLNVLLKSNERLTSKQICAVLNAEGIPWLLRTVSTFLDRLEEKELVSHEKIGITHYYYPIVDRAEYQVEAAKSFLGKYFDGSFKEMLSAFAEKGELSDSEISDIENWIKENRE